METLKSLLFGIITLMVLAILGYWAFFTIESGGTHAEKQKIEELEDANEALTKEVENLKDQIATLKAEEAETPPAETPVTPTYTTPTTTPTPPSTSTTTKNQTLINELQKLVDDKVYMKEKSKGTRVGTVQNFLNLYFKTSKKVDNDYGATTKADIMKFQKAEGLTADGEAGPTTFQKMIDWLKKQ